MDSWFILSCKQHIPNFRCKECHDDTEIDSFLWKQAHWQGNTNWGSRNWNIVLSVVKVSLVTHFPMNFDQDLERPTKISSWRLERQGENGRRSTRDLLLFVRHFGPWAYSGIHPPFSSPPHGTRSTFGSRVLLHLGCGRAGIFLRVFSYLFTSEFGQTTSEWKYPAVPHNTGLVTRCSWLSYNPPPPPPLPTLGNQRLPWVNFATR